MLSCPACAGVLRADISPSHGFLTFICSVGHTFSLTELYIAKEDQLESAQWSLIVLFKHLQAVLSAALASDNGPPFPAPSRDLQRRLNQISRHITLVERTIDETRLLVLKDGSGEDAPVLTEDP